MSATSNSYPPVDFSYRKLNVCKGTVSFDSDSLDMLKTEPRTGQRNKIRKEKEVKVSEVVHDSELKINRGKEKVSSPTKASASAFGATSTSNVAKSIENDKKKLEEKKIGSTEEETKYTGYLGPAIKLCNNNLSTMEGFSETCQKLMENPDSIRWLDLSFNNFENVDTICALPLELEVLYLHGNAIGDIKEVAKLAKFKHLRSLTLHGNPMDEVKNYRYHVLALIPSLKSLDFAAVTKKDADTALTFQSLFLKNKGKKRSAES